VRWTGFVCGADDEGTARTNDPAGSAREGAAAERDEATPANRVSEALEGGGVDQLEYRIAATQQIIGELLI